MTSRIAPAPRPYEPDMEATLDKLMPEGVEALSLFRVLARNPRVFRRFMAGGLLDRGSLTMRDRELVIDRTTARCGAEYEWGVHVAFFGPRVELTAEQIAATVAPHGTLAPCWSAREAALLSLVDALVDTRGASDEIWARAREHLTEEQLLEVIVLTGQYVMVSTLANALCLSPEPFGARFPVMNDRMEPDEHVLRRTSLAHSATPGSLKNP
jgi:alkylhydroperoxidase family enzyme